MSNLAIKLSVLDDLDRDFPLLTRTSENVNIAYPVLSQTQPYDVTGASFEASVQITGTRNFIPLTVALTSNVMKLTLPNSIVKTLVDKPARYFVAMTKNGKTRRLWADDFAVKAETEA